ncbi:ABC-three component system middle component 1 [Streptococcus suis]|uniref:ABC-three component system middle component 1 n=1 Tax=Streptococcus suis TaxID=1307 RepID=UPI002FC830BE
MMHNFIKQILEKHDYQHIGGNVELWSNNNEFFIIQDYDVEELQSSRDITINFFTSDKINQLIHEFEKIQDNRIKKNTSLLIVVKVENLENEYYRLKNIVMRIEEDEYYFRKYVIFYTESGLEKLEPCAQYLLDYIQDNGGDLGESLFDKFENNMFFDDGYFIAMQLIIKLPFISLPHSDARFETIEDRIKSRMETLELVEQEQQVNEILNLFNNDNIGEQLEDSDILDDLNQILGD